MDVYTEVYETNAECANTYGVPNIRYLFVGHIGGTLILEDRPSGPGLKRRLGFYILAFRDMGANEGHLNPKP